jgi:hypothetical protein
VPSGFDAANIDALQQHIRTFTLERAQQIVEQRRVRGGAGVEVGGEADAQRARQRLARAQYELVAGDPHPSQTAQAVAQLGQVAAQEHGVQDAFGKIADRAVGLGLGHALQLVKSALYTMARADGGV